MMKNQKEISVVIPVYGSPESVRPLCERLKESLEQFTDSYEVVLVNDSCPKDSWGKILEMCSIDKNIVGINLTRNFGQINAINAGLDNCNGQWIVVMDCDLQNYPEDIHLLYEKAKSGYDVVLSRRYERKENAVSAFLSRSFYKVLSYLSGNDIDPEISNFSICKRKVVQKYLSMKEQANAYIYYIRWMGFKTAVIDVEHHERYEGHSSYTFRKKMSQATSMIVANSTKLLSMFIKLGIAMAMISFIAIIVIICQYFMEGTLAGWASTMVSIFFVGGLILVNMGVVGLYIGKVYERVKDRPIYIIDEIVNEEE